jgi:hypothetical protein
MTGFSMLSKLQKEHAVWQRRNFPNAEKWECLVGLQEEVGELAHEVKERDYRPERER